MEEVEEVVTVVVIAVLAAEEEVVEEAEVAMDNNAVDTAVEAMKKRYPQTK